MLIRSLIFVIIASLSFNSFSQNQEGRFLGSKITKMPTWFFSSFMDLSEDVTESAQMGKKLLVYFHQDGCPYCNLLITKNFSDKATKAKIQEAFNVIEINMWGDREVTNFNNKSFTEKDFAVFHKVQFTPTLIFFNEKGQQVLRLNGYLPLDEFNQALDFVIADSFKSQTFAQYQKAKSDPKSKGELIAEPDLFSKQPYDLTKSKKPVVVFFESKNCKNCESFHNKVLNDETTRSILKELTVIQLDLHSNTKITTANGKELTAQQWAKQLNVNFSPTIVFFNQSGKEIIRSEAVFKTFHFQSIADYVKTESYKHEAQFQRYLTERAERIRATGKDVNIWQ